MPSNDIITEGNPGLTETIQSSDSVNIQTEGSEFGENGLTEGNHGSKEHCSFRMEKPKMPKFYGDVIEYFIFKAVFKHLVETRYSKRDSITLLRSCLQGKPQELIKGIVQDYDAAWEYLDSIYGDPRLVADTIIQDITKFKTLRDSEEARFCDLVHLVRRSFNVLTEVGRKNDMDNSHMLVFIEQRMSADDRKVWSRLKFAFIVQQPSWIDVMYFCHQCEATRVKVNFRRSKICHHAEQRSLLRAAMSK